MPLHDLTGKICRFSEHFTLSAGPNLSRSRTERLLGGPRNRIAGVLNQTKSTRSRAKLLPQPPRDFVIKRLRGGGYNRVIGIRVSQSDNEDPAKLILGVPRFTDSQHDLEVAVLRFVRQHTSIPVPEAKFVEFKSNNPLKQRYAI